MTDPEIYALENKYGVQGIDSGEKHLKYFCDEDRLALGIAGEKGMTALTVAQAVALCRDVPGILRVYFGVDVEIYQPQNRVKNNGLYGISNQAKSAS